MKREIVLPLLFIVACSSNSTQPIPKSPEAKPVHYCEMSSGDLYKFVRPPPGPSRVSSYGQTMEEKEREYQAEIADYHSKIQFFSEKYNESIKDCGKNSQAANHFQERINNWGVPDIGKFLLHNLMQTIERNKQERLNYYQQNSFSVKDQVLKVDVIDIYQSKFTLNLSSLNKTKILSVNAVTQKKYLRADGIEAPLFVLTGIKVSDEFGNQYRQFAEPTLIQEIVPNKPSEFQFTTNAFIEAANFAIIKIEPMAFGNLKQLELKVPLHKMKKIPLSVAIHQELGLKGLKAYSKSCVSRWLQSSATFLPLPLDEGDIKLCAIIDMVVNKIESVDEKDLGTSEIEYFRRLNIHARVEDQLKKKSGLSKNEIDRRIADWEQQSKTEFLELSRLESESKIK